MSNLGAGLGLSRFLAGFFRFCGLLFLLLRNFDQIIFIHGRTTKGTIGR